MEGLSPPARGSLERHCGGVVGVRSIPARAGEPPAATCSGVAAWVYPRPRGGATTVTYQHTSHRGLSPPARGSHLVVVDAPTCRGSIPARAGEPPFGASADKMAVIYPRPRGGASRRYCTTCSLWGLSPPARGSRLLLALSIELHRSIPARAGEPGHSLDQRSANRVYPRPRGGAGGVALPALTASGLSPPARGSRRYGGRCCACSRSIPARAGEPTGFSSATKPPRVYPRPRGGAIMSRISSRSSTGLSPPARGSRNRSQRRLRHHGSIPARAGEPEVQGATSLIWKVYPRPRGGAIDTCGMAEQYVGLSPPARGSRAQTTGLHTWSRSIPARAGEPLNNGDWGAWVKVYPRPRGGAPPLEYTCSTYVRSIPARAGEPGLFACVKTPKGVYPRPRGGAMRRCDEHFLMRGLSPPARGSLERGQSDRWRAGSIPARAGEPTMC